MRSSSSEDAEEPEGRPCIFHIKRDTIRPNIADRPPFVPSFLVEAPQPAAHLLFSRGASGWGRSGTAIAPPHPSHVTQTRPASLPASSRPHRRCSSKKAVRFSTSV